MRGLDHRASFAWLALVLLACGSGERAGPTPPTSAPPSSVAPPAPSAAPARSVPSATDVSALPTEPPPATLAIDPASLSATPGAMDGPPIRLRSTLEIGRREVSGRTMPSVTLSDPAAQEAFDTLFARQSYARCRIELAIETFIAASCSYTDENAFTSTQAELYEIRGSEVTHVEPLSLFLDGVENFALLRRLQRDPHGGVIPMVVTAIGIEIRYEDADRIVRAPWRALAPLLRPDSPLGVALAAEGLVLPSAGTPFPPAPPVAAAIWSDDPDALFDRVRGMPSALRDVVRYVDPGGQRYCCALVFPPGTEAPDASGEAYYVEPMASFVLARATGALVVHAEPGPRAEVVAERPAGTLLPVVVGTLDRTRSAIERGAWARVLMGGRGGWVQARALVAADASACPELARPDAPPDPHAERGVVGEGDARRAWFFSPGALSAYTLAPDCAVGARTMTSPLGALSDLVAIPATPAGAPTLLVATGAFGLRAYDLDHDAPLLEIPAPVDDYETAVRRGPHGEPGPLPLRVRSGATDTFYQWVSGALVPLAP